MLTEKVKENPIKSIISAISVFTLSMGLYSGILALDSRYAKADDIYKQQQQIERSSTETKFAIDQLRKQSIEDKIFEIELLPEDKRTHIDKARLEKYKRDAKNIDIKWK